MIPENFCVTLHLVCLRHIVDLLQLFNMFRGVQRQGTIANTSKMWAQFSSQLHRHVASEAIDLSSLPFVIARFI